MIIMDGLLAAIIVAYLPTDEVLAGWSLCILLSWLKTIESSSAGLVISELWL
jgi:hypothetical protein